MYTIKDIKNKFKKKLFVASGSYFPNEMSFANNQ